MKYGSLDRSIVSKANRRRRSLRSIACYTHQPHAISIAKSCNSINFNNPSILQEVYGTGESAGHSVKTANVGYECISSVASHIPDLLFEFCEAEMRKGDRDSMRREDHITHKRDMGPPTTWRTPVHQVNQSSHFLRCYSEATTHEEVDWLETMAMLLIARCCPPFGARLNFLK